MSEFEFPDSHPDPRGIAMMHGIVVAMFGLPGGVEWVVIGVVALLVFGRRLPDVARSVGKSIVEFKKGLRDVKDDIDQQARINSAPRAELTDDSPQSVQEAAKPEPRKSSDPAAESPHPQGHA